MGRFSFLRSDRQAPASGKARSDFDDDFVADAAAAKRGGKLKEAADPTLPEKKRARRRLVGAITLSLTAAVVLPLVFDPEPKPVSQDIAIDVSSRSKPAPVAAAEPAPAATAPQATPETPAVPVAAAAVAGTAAAVVAAKAVAAPPAPAAPPKPAAKPAEAPAPAAKPAPEPKAAASEQGKYMIQVAALGSQKKASELQTKLKAAGIKSHTQKVATQDGERIRVRIGPLASKKEADGMCAKLSKIRQQCTLVPG